MRQYLHSVAPQISTIIWLLYHSTCQQFCSLKYIVKLSAVLPFCSGGVSSSAVSKNWNSCQQFCSFKNLEELSAFLQFEISCKSVSSSVLLQFQICSGGVSSSAVSKIWKSCQKFCSFNNLEKLSAFLQLCSLKYLVKLSAFLQFEISCKAVSISAVLQFEISCKAVSRSAVWNIPRSKYTDIMRLLRRLPWYHTCKSVFANNDVPAFQAVMVTGI